MSIVFCEEVQKPRVFVLIIAAGEISAWNHGFANGMDKTGATSPRKGSGLNALIIAVAINNRPRLAARRINIGRAINNRPYRLGFGAYPPHKPRLELARKIGYNIIRKGARIRLAV